MSAYHGSMTTTQEDTMYDLDTRCLDCDRRFCSGNPCRPESIVPTGPLAQMLAGR
jgi:hypothetical protein